MSTAENQALIAEAFAAWEHGDYHPFFKVVSDDVRWTVIGTTPISGTFEGKQAFLDGAVVPLHDRLAGPIRATVLNVFGDGDHVILSGGASRVRDPVGRTHRPTAGSCAWPATWSSR